MALVGISMIRGLGALFFWGLAVAAAPIRAQEVYLLSEGDEVRVIAPDLPGLAGVYRLGQGGRIALPVEGEVTLGGYDLGSATEALRAALAAEVVAPRVGLELVTRRPFFILGDVAAPGAYPAAPGLTLEQALALAGGVWRPGEAAALQAVTGDIRAREEFARSHHDHAALTLRALRLEAALADAPEVTVPAALAHDPRLADLVARERDIHAASQAAFAARAASVQALLDARSSEIAALEGRLEGSARQTTQIAQEVADARALLDRGLAPAARLNALLREADRQQGAVLQLTVQLAQARQAAAQLEVERVNFPRERAVAFAERLIDTRARIAALEQSMAAARALLAVGETLGFAGADAGPPRLHVTLRAPDGTERDIAQDSAAIIRSGDVVTVWRRDLRRAGEW